MPLFFLCIFFKILQLFVHFFSFKFHYYFLNIIFYYSTTFNPCPHRHKERVTVVCLSFGLNISGRLYKNIEMAAYQQTWNYTRIKIKDRLYLKRFGYEVMTIFTTHDCRFTTFETSSLIFKFKNYGDCDYIILLRSLAHETITIISLVII